MMDDRFKKKTTDKTKIEKRAKAARIIKGAVSVVGLAVVAVMTLGKFGGKKS